MFSIVKAKSSEYFAEAIPHFELYEKARTYKDKRRFFLYFISFHLNEPQKIVDFVSLLTDKKIFEEEIFLSVIWGISLQLQNQNAEQTQLSDLITLLNAKSSISKIKLLQNLPENLITKSSLMEEQQIDKKYKRAYTKTYFEQNKYSLAKENNEGFSKMFLFLTNLNDSLPVEDTWNNILSLIGKFDLDPDRVIDLIVQVQLLNTHKSIYGGLVAKFKGQSITIILANRLAKVLQKKAKSLVFAGYFENFINVSMEDVFRKYGDIPNPKLISLVADLVCSGVIQIEKIEKFLEPSNSTLQEVNYRRIKHGEERVSKSFKISLEELSESQKKTLFDEDNQKFLGQLLYSSRLAFYAQFVKRNQWSIFENLWTQHKKAFDLLLYHPLLNGILDLLEWSIEPVYHQISIGRFLKKGKSQQKFTENTKGIKKLLQVDEEFFSTILNLLSYVKDYIGFKHSLFTKLCRIFKAVQKGTLKLLCQNIEYGRQSMKFIIKNYIVPGVGYQQINPALGMEAFSLLQLYPYQFRYQCYLEVYKNKLNHNPFTAKIFEHVKNKQNIIVNNLSNDNKKQFGKRLGKITHNHALQVMYWIARRLLKEDYEAVVPQIISALNCSTQMTLEQTMFLMLFYLNENPEPAVKIKIAEYQPWFKNIIMFVSLFYRKYLQVDLQPIFDFFLMKTSHEIRDLEDNQQMPGAYIKLLHQLLNKMLGSFIIEDINKAKYEILSAGPKLQIQLLYLTSEIRAAKKSKHTLEQFFWDKTSSHFENNTLAFNLLVLLCQKRAEFMHKTYIDNLKIVGDNYDEFTSLIIQLVRVLNYQATDFNRYAQLLPENSIDVLINKYKIPIEIAFQIVRGSVKPIAKMTQDQWNGLKAQVQNAINNFSTNTDYLYVGYAQDYVKNFFNQSKILMKDILPIGLFTTFWFLQLDSIYFPQKLYSQKIQDLRKKIDPLLLKKNEKNDKNDRQVQKNKTLFDKLKKEEEFQKQKYNQTLGTENLKKFQVPELRNYNKQAIITFAGAFVQNCLLPRLLLDPRQAIYCMKFTILLIKTNKVSPSKSIILISYIVEFVLNYLPFSTKREAQNCLATFLSQLLGIFINWNDPAKLKQDLKTYLDSEDLKENSYQKLRSYLIKLFERFGYIIKGIKKEPYVIKNCLYLLEKIDAIPGYKEQAEQLEEHMKQLRLNHGGIDMRTILDMQIAILGSKKLKLSNKPEDKTSMSLQNIPQPQKVQIIKAPVAQSSKPQVYLALEKQKQRRQQRVSKDREKEKERVSKQRAYQKESKDRQKGKDSKDRERQSYRDSKDRLSKDDTRKKDKQKDGRSKDRETENQALTKQSKFGREKQQQKPRNQQQKFRGQSKDKKLQKQGFKQKNNFQKQKNDQQKPFKKDPTPSRGFQKPLMKGQDKNTSSRPPVNQQQVQNNYSAKEQLGKRGRQNFQKSNIQHQSQAIKRSTMTVKEMRQRQQQRENPTQQPKTSRSDVNTQRIQMQVQKGTIQIALEAQKVQNYNQSQKKEDFNKSDSNQNNEKESKLSKGSSPEKSRSSIQAIQSINPTEVISQTSKKVIHHNQNNGLIKISPQLKKESTQNKKAEQLKTQQIRIGPKKEIMERLNQTYPKKDSTGKAQSTSIIIKPVQKSVIIQQQAKSEPIVQVINKKQESKPIKQQIQQIKILQKQSTTDNYKRKDQQKHSQPRQTRDYRKQGQGHRDDRVQDNRAKDRDDRHNPHSKDSYRESKDRSQHRKDREADRSQYRQNKGKDPYIRERQDKDRNDRKDRERDQRKERDDKKEHRRDQDDRRPKNERDRDDRDDRRDRDTHRDPEDRRANQDRRSKDNREHSKSKYMEKEKDRDRRDDYDRGRKDKKHNRSRSRDKHSSRK